MTGTLATVKVTLRDDGGGTQTVYLCGSHADKLPYLGKYAPVIEDVKVIGPACEACDMAAAQRRAKMVPG